MAMTVQQAIAHLKAKGMWLNPLTVAVSRALAEWRFYAVEKKRDKTGV